MGKVVITLKIVQIEEKSYFLHYFPREKARQFGNMTQINGAGQLLYTIFCLKIAFEKVFPKAGKNGYKTYFIQFSQKTNNF